MWPQKAAVRCQYHWPNCCCQGEGSAFDFLTRHSQVQSAASSFQGFERRDDTLGNIERNSIAVCFNASAAKALMDSQVQSKFHQIHMASHVFMILPSRPHLVDLMPWQKSGELCKWWNSGMEEVLPFQTSTIYQVHHFVVATQVVLTSLSLEFSNQIDELRNNHGNITNKNFKAAVLRLRGTCQDQVLRGRHYVYGTL